MGEDNNEKQWREALDQLTKNGDASGLAELLRSDVTIPRHVRGALAELLAPKLTFFPSKLELSPNPEWEKQKKHRQNRADAIVRLHKEQREKNCTVEVAAENVGDDLGISDRAVLKRASLRSTDVVDQQDKNFLRLVVNLELASGEPRDPDGKILIRLGEDTFIEATIVPRKKPRS